MRVVGAARRAALAVNPNRNANAISKCGAEKSEKVDMISNVWIVIPDTVVHFIFEMEVRKCIVGSSFIQNLSFKYIQWLAHHAHPQVDKSCILGIRPGC